MNRWLYGYVGGVAAVGAITVVQNQWDLSKSDWASWAQAIGTVAAVIGAVWVALYQTEVARQSEEARERDKDLRAYGLLQSIVLRMYSATQAIAYHLKRGNALEELEELTRRSRRRDEFKQITQ